MLRLYILLGGLLAAVSVAFAAAWSWRASIAETEIREAENSAIVNTVQSIQKELDQERVQRAEFQKRINVALEQMRIGMRQIEASRVQATSDIRQDRLEHKDFYDQPLPDRGRQSWIQARSAATSASPASSPASSP